MNTIRTILYIITFTILGIVSAKLAVTGYHGIIHFKGYTASTSEIHVILSGILEIIILTVVFFLFFVPVGKTKKTKENIYYLVESMSSSIKDLVDNWGGDKEARREKLSIFLYNFVSYIGILSIYIFLLLRLGGEINGLRALIILLVTVLIVKSIDSINSITRQLDLQSDKRIQGDGMSITTKKNLIVLIELILFFFIAFFLKDIVDYIAGIFDGILPFLDKNRAISK